MKKKKIFEKGDRIIYDNENYLYLGKIFKDTKLPKEPVAIKSFRMLKPCRPKTMPINRPETIIMITDWTPTK